MSDFKYSLLKKGKAICPECGRKTFVLYIDNNTGKPLHSATGKCDRADNCGCHYTPKQYFNDNNILFNKENYIPVKPMFKPQCKPSYVDVELLKQSLRDYEENGLIRYLYGIIGAEAVNEVISRYFIGTSKHWSSSTVFWQIDMNGKIRAGKIMQYDSRTGKRVKQPINKISWVHTALKLPNFHLSQCLFGEHLLRDNTKMVAVVESEKTAIIASIYLPDMIWLACGGCGNLSMKFCKSLKSRNVVLFPDAGKYNEWSGKAKALSTFCSISVSSLIEEKASDEERKAGFDLADYLVRFSPAETEAAGNTTGTKQTIIDNLIK